MSEKDDREWRARCFLKGFCEQCPAKSWAESGTLDTPVEYLCEVAHTKARYLGCLDENEREERRLRDVRKPLDKMAGMYTEGLLC